MGVIGNYRDRKSYQPAYRLILMTSEKNVVLFDLGNTLIYSKNPWNGILYKGIEEFYFSILTIDPSIREKITVPEIQECMNSYYDLRLKNLIETTSYRILDSCLKSKNIFTISDKDLSIAIQAMYSITQLNWEIDLDTIPTLLEIKEQGYRLGILSNAADDLDVQQLIDRWDLRRFFEFILTSAACGYRKPHPFMFQKALTFFDSSSTNIIMVGDTLNADILGANKMEIFSVLLNRNSTFSQDNSDIKPSKVIHELKELLPILNSLKN